MLALFLDESGDHSLSVIDPQYPVFVLGGCMFEEAYHDNEFSDATAALKVKHFGSSEINLHTLDIVRCRGPFQSLTNAKKRHHFYADLRQYFESTRVHLVACAIRKKLHVARYGMRALDPYHLSLSVLVERFIFAIRHHPNIDQGYIVAESRDEILDQKLQLAWMDLRLTGTNYVQGKEIRDRITNLFIRKKKENIPGLQMADLIVSPVGRYVIGKPPRPDWFTVQGKFRKGPAGQIEGYGLVILPK